jgi:hypothetical protein
MTQICIELITGTFTLVAVVLGSVIGLNIYFRQKEYELVKQRYLEGAVDVVAAQLESSIGIVSHNYSRCLQLSKSLRDVGEHFDLSELKRGFIELDVSKFHQIAHHRIGTLLESQIIWEVFQLAMAYATSANNVITQEIPEAIRLRITTNMIEHDYATIADELANKLQELHNEGFKYSDLLNELNTLSRMLEAEKLNLKAISKFNRRPEIESIVERLKQAFPNDEETTQ